MTAPVVSLSSSGPNMLYFLPISSAILMAPAAVLKLISDGRVGVRPGERERERDGGVGSKQ